MAAALPSPLPGWVMCGSIHSPSFIPIPSSSSSLHAHPRPIQHQPPPGQVPAAAVLVGDIPLAIFKYTCRYFTFQSKHCLAQPATTPPHPPPPLGSGASAEERPWVRSAASGCSVASCLGHAAAAEHPAAISAVPLKNSGQL